MNNDELTTENFWQVFSNLEPWTPPVVFWRLYYDEHGRPLFYTQEDKPGNYIDVTPEQYQLGDMTVRVKNGKLIKLSAPPTTKLVPNESGVACHPSDVTVVVAESQPHTKWSQRVFESD